MQTFDAKVNHKNKFVPFVIAYIPNPDLNQQEQFFATNDLNFHNSLSWWAHNIITLYVDDIEQAITQAEELGRTTILCVTKGLTYLDRFVQTIIDSNYLDLDNWNTHLLQWINLDSNKTIEVPDNIVKVQIKTEQHEDFSITENYYNIITNHRKWYVTNTETVSFESPQEHTNEIMVTAGALTPAIYAMNKFTQPGYINIVDSSNVAHHMWDYIIENWNGKNYADFIRNFYKKYPSIVNDFTAYQEDKLQAYSDFVNTDDFINKWELVKNSKQQHFFKDILVNEPCHIIETSEALSSYINFSNAYNYYPTAVCFSQEERYKKYLKVCDSVRSRTLRGHKCIFDKRGMDGILRYIGRRP